MNRWQGLSRDIPCMNQDHHDKQWTYIHKRAEFNINMDETPETCLRKSSFISISVILQWIPHRLGKPILHKDT
eukprot:12526363-Heterocapsa_arctica.AAC.1